jgi:hypothetical protein
VQNVPRRLILISCRDVTASFTSLSAKLAYLVIEIHRVLGDAILSSMSTPPLTIALLQVRGLLNQRTR